MFTHFLGFILGKSFFDTGFSFDETINFEGFVEFLSRFYTKNSLKDLSFFVKKFDGSGHLFKHEGSTLNEGRLVFHLNGNRHDFKESFSFKKGVKRTACSVCFNVEKPVRFWLDAVSDFKETLTDAKEFFFRTIFTEDTFKVSSNFKKNVDSIRDTGILCSIVANNFYPDGPEDYFMFEDKKNWFVTGDALLNLYLSHLYHLQPFIQNASELDVFIDEVLIPDYRKRKFLFMSKENYSFVNDVLLKDDAWKKISKANIIKGMIAHKVSTGNMGTPDNISRSCKKFAKKRVYSDDMMLSLVDFTLYESPDYPMPGPGCFDFVGQDYISLFFAYAFGKFEGNAFCMVLPDKYHQVYEMAYPDGESVVCNKEFSPEAMSNLLALYPTLKEEHSLDEIIAIAANV